MLKRTFITAALFMCILFVKGQTTKNEVPVVKTKMDAFVSKTGTITRFIDYKLPSLKSTFSDAETRIRKIGNGSVYAYFYQIVKDGKYSDDVASIEYTDLLEVIKALSVLKDQTDKDKSLNPDYLENKFISVDGFQIGYYVSKGEVGWYIKIDKYGSDNTLYIKNVEAIETAFLTAKGKIEELKK